MAESGLFEKNGDRAKACRTSALKRDFVTVTEFVPGESARIHYGGDQAWLSRVTERRGGCAQTCAANLLAYASQDFPALRERYDISGALIEKAEFTRLLNDVYAALPSLELPILNRAADRGAHAGLSTLGVGNPFRFAARVVKFAEKRGVLLRAHVLAPPRARETMTEFIKAGILADAPVALLNLFLPAVMLPPSGAQKNAQPYNNHWVTVTGLREYAAGEAVLDVSSWGKRFELALSQFFGKGRRNASLSAVYFTKR